MQKEIVSARQMICIIVMFIFGSSVIVGVSSKAEQDSWISLFLAMIISALIFTIYAKIIKLFPGKDFFEIVELVLGKIFSKIIILLMTWYALHLGALVMRNFTEFIQISFMPETPQIPIIISLFIVIVYMAKSGIETMGKWSIIMLTVIVSVVFMTILISLNKMDFENILPVMGQDFKTISSGALQIIAFPFAETVLFLSLSSAIRKRESPYKIYLYALLISTLVLLATMFRNLFVLGPAMVSASYFPSFVAVKIIDAGAFFTRMEGLIAMNLIVAGIIKITVCVMAASKGAAKLFNMKNYRQILVPVGLLSLALSVIVFDNVMRMFDFLKIYTFYAIPFQFIIPLIILIAAEIKKRKKKSS